MSQEVVVIERQPGGKYILKVAYFAEAPQPHFADVRSYDRGVAYLEVGSFTSDKP